MKCKCNLLFLLLCVWSCVQLGATDEVSKSVPFSNLYVASSIPKENLLQAIQDWRKDFMNVYKKVITKPIESWDAEAAGCVDLKNHWFMIDSI